MKNGEGKRGVKEKNRHQTLQSVSVVCILPRSIKIAPLDSSSPLASALAQYSARTGDAWSVLCSV